MYVCSQARNSSEVDGSAGLHSALDHTRTANQGASIDKLVTIAST